MNDVINCVALEDFKILIVGKLSKSKPALTKIIQSLGGQVVNDVNSSTTLCISNRGLYEYGRVCSVWLVGWLCVYSSFIILHSWVCMEMNLS